jgi:hypothetical protein
MEHRHGGGDHRVAAEPALVRRAVESHQGTIDLLLIEGIAAAQSRRDLVRDVAQSAMDVEAPEGGAAIAQVQGFAGAGGSACRCDGTAAGAAFERHLDLDGGPPTGIPDATAAQFGDGCGHEMSCA